MFVFSNELVSGSLLVMAILLSKQRLHSFEVLRAGAVLFFSGLFFDLSYII